MANKRTGVYGTYYGSYYTESEALTTAEMKVNAEYIYKALVSKGWNIKGISALLGNMQAESTINPGRWQSDSVNNTSGGYGLVQWTPATKYTVWSIENAYNDPSEMDANLFRIAYELEYGTQWIATNSYDYSFKTFATSTDKSVSELAIAFLLNYERPADQSVSVQNYRSELANNWYTYLSNGNFEGGTGGSQGSGITKKKKGFNFILFNRRRKQQWINKSI